jgi:hypothetical protein
MFNVTQGEDVSIPVKLAFKSGRRFDLTGKTVTAKLKINNVVTTLTVGSGVTIVNAIDGDIIVGTTDAQSLQLAKGDLPIDVIVVDGSDTKIFRIRNKVLVSENLT